MWPQLKDLGFNSQFELHSFRVIHPPSPKSPGHGLPAQGSGTNLQAIHSKGGIFMCSSFMGRPVSSVHESFSDWDPRGCVKMTCCHPPSESQSILGFGVRELGSNPRSFLAVSPHTSYSLICVPCVSSCIIAIKTIPVKKLTKDLITLKNNTYLTTKGC